MTDIRARRLLTISKRAALLAWALSSAACMGKWRASCESDGQLSVIRDGSGAIIASVDCFAEGQSCVPETSTCRHRVTASRVLPAPGSDDPDPEIVDLAASATHACAVTRSGRLWCWGYNGSCELGVPNENCNALDESDFVASDYRPNRAPPKPYQVDELAGLAGQVLHVSAGAAHTCVIDSASNVYCWGSDVAGQLGDRSATSCQSLNQSQGPARYQRTVVTFPDGQKPVLALTSGYAHTCALRMSSTGPNDTEVWCWGANYLGQCGPAQDTGAVPGSGDGGCLPYCNSDGSDAGRCINPTICSDLNPTTPTRVVPTADVTFAPARIIAEGQHTCAQSGSNTLYCWGANQGGYDDHQLYPQLLGVSPGGGQLNGDEHVCFRSLPTKMLGEFIADFSLGYASSYTLNAVGSYVYAWGANTSAQLGDGLAGDLAGDAGTYPFSTGQFVRVNGGASLALQNVKHLISSEGADQCAILYDNDVWCWGMNNHDELGELIANGDASPVAVPLQLSNGSAVGIGGAGIKHDSTDPLRALFVRGSDYGCSVPADHPTEVWCWGALPNSN
jgi:alpha-tubulin suppressor-like RCC1 family protein